MFRLLKIYPSRDTVPLIEGNGVWSADDHPAREWDGFNGDSGGDGGGDQHADHEGAPAAHDAAGDDIQEAVALRTLVLRCEPLRTGIWSCEPRVQILRGTPLCHALVKFSFKNRFTYLSLEISYVDSYIYLDKNWFSRFKSENSSFLIWTLCNCPEI